MASPSDNSSILSGPYVSTSPKTIRGNSEHSHSPVRHRGSVSEETDLIPRARMSPTLTRSYNPNDPDVRERQRAMDADMAMQLSRARSNTLVQSSPIAIPAPSSARPPLDHDDQPFISLSQHEEQDLNFARGAGHVPLGLDEPMDSYHPGPAAEVHLNHLSTGHDPALLVSLNGPEPDDAGGLPMYQPTAPAELQQYDFTTLEAYAREEKARLGIQSPTTPTPPDGPLSSSQVTTSTVPALPETRPNGPGDFTIPMPGIRTRQRKLSQSAPGPRRGKMALFEHSSGGPPPALNFRSQGNGLGKVLSAVPSYDNLPAPGPPDFARQNTAGSGHDRPYRFSFYSNALSATIHARSLSELPADGQSFEDLFMGVNGSNERIDGAILSRPGTSMGHNPANGSGLGQRLGIPPPINIPSTSKMSGTEPRNRTTAVNGPGQSIDGSTWWLDVQCPTDEEMKMLSKVRYSELTTGVVLSFL